MGETARITRSLAGRTARASNRDGSWGRSVRATGRGRGNTEDGPRVWPGLRDGFQEEMPPSGPKANLRAAATTAPASDTPSKTGLNRRLAGTPECPRSAPGEFHRGCTRGPQNVRGRPRESSTGAARGWRGARPAPRPAQAQVQALLAGRPVAQGSKL